MASNENLNCNVKRSAAIGSNDEANQRLKMNTTQEYIASLLNSDSLADVVFIVGENDDQQKIFAHKLILNGRSKVFKDMFTSPLTTQKSEIEIPDVSPSGFLALMKYIYCDKIDIHGANVLSTLYTAKKFDVSSLATHCERFLISSLRTDNAFGLLTVARHFGANLLSDKCFKHIDTNASDVFATEGFLDIDHDCLCLILERDTLVIREIELFNHIIRWANSKLEKHNSDISPEDQRFVLGRALKLIRYTLMSIQDFANGPVESGLLTCQFAVEVYQYFLVVPQKSNVSFITRPRALKEVNEAGNRPSSHQSWKTTTPLAGAQNLSWRSKPGRVDPMTTSQYVAAGDAPCSDVIQNTQENPLRMKNIKWKNKNSKTVL